MDALREDVEALNKKLAELTEDELKRVAAGAFPSPKIDEDPSFDAEKERGILRSRAGDQTDLDTRKDLYENIIL